jgi:hypothetical protein
MSERRSERRRERGARGGERGAGEIFGQANADDACASRPFVLLPSEKSRLEVAGRELLVESEREAEDTSAMLCAAHKRARAPRLTCRSQRAAYRAATATRESQKSAHPPHAHA